jgi:hypothetical protein
LQFVDHRKGECGVGVNQQVDRVIRRLRKKHGDARNSPRSAPAGMPTRVSGWEVP